jgi:hypothetical protein
MADLVNMIYHSVITNRVATDAAGVTVALPQQSDGHMTMDISRPCHATDCITCRIFHSLKWQVLLTFCYIRAAKYVISMRGTLNVT